MPEVPPPESLKSYPDLFPDGEPPYRFWYNVESRIIDLERVLNPQDPRPPGYREWFRFTPRAAGGLRLAHRRRRALETLEARRR